MCAAVYRYRHLVKATEVTVGLAESNGSLLPGNGSLLPGIWRDSLHVTCGLTACTPGSAPGPTLGNEYGKTLPFKQVGDRNGTVLLRSASYNFWLIRPTSSYPLFVFITHRMFWRGCFAAHRLLRPEETIRIYLNP